MKLIDTDVIFKYFCKNAKAKTSRTFEKSKKGKNFICHEMAVDVNAFDSRLLRNLKTGLSDLKQV